MMNEPVHFSGDGVERGLRLVGVATVILTIFTITIAVLSIPSILTTAEDAAVASDAGSLLACRSEARANVDDAISTALARNSDLVATISQLTEAAAASDTTQISALSTQASTNRVALAEATSDLLTATVAYNDSIRLSIQAPEEFLSACEE